MPVRVPALRRQAGPTGDTSAAQSARGFGIHSPASHVHEALAHSFGRIDPPAAFEAPVLSPFQRQALGQQSGNRTRMPDRLRTGLDRLSGADLSGVRIHRNSNDPAPGQVPRGGRGGARIEPRQMPLQLAKLGDELYSARKYVKWYFSGSTAKQRKGDVLREIYTQIGVDNDSPEDRRTKAKLKQDGVIDDDDIRDLEQNVNAYLGGGATALPPERKKMPPDTWRHIWRGDFNAGKNKATGYHWKGKGGESWLEGTGTTGTTQSSFYEEQVQVRDDKVDDIVAETRAGRGNVNGKIKEDFSTFFPDNWSETDVKDAVELRDSQGQITSKPADGIVLVKSGKTIYPIIS